MSKIEKLTQLFLILSFLLCACSNDDKQYLETENQTLTIKAQTFTVAENIDDEFVIGKLEALGVDDDAFAFEIVEDDSQMFELNTSGELSLATGVILDFDIAQQHIITVSLNDKENKAFANVTINVTNVPTVQVTFPEIGEVDYDPLIVYRYTINLELTELHFEDIFVFVTSIGEAEIGVDFDISDNLINIPANTKTSSFDIVIYGQTIRKADETMLIQVGDDRTTNAYISPVTISIKLNKTPDCILFPDASMLLGDYTEIADGGNPQESIVTLVSNGTTDGVTIRNFGFSSYWWCGHSDAEIDIILNNCENSIHFPDSDSNTIQEVANLFNMCGQYGVPSLRLKEPGSYNPNTGIITFTAEVTVADGTFGDVEYTFTPK
ncbi:MAG: hypothetical protein AAF600_22440 [Bacteroidota bacterium]